MRSAAFAAVCALAMLFSLPVPAQYTGLSGFGYNNPMSASIDTMLWNNMASRRTYRRILERNGYSAEQIDKMSDAQMQAALRGGGAPKAKTPAPKVKAGPFLYASRFVPAKKRLVLDALADAFVEDQAQRATMREVFAEGMAAYEKEAAKDGLVNDIAGASAFLIGTAYFVLHDGEEPDDEGLTLAARQLQVLFDTPEMKQQPDAEKQKFYELLIGLSTWLGATFQLAQQENDQELLGLLKGTAHDALAGYLKLDPAKLKITANGMEVTP